MCHVLRVTCYVPCVACDMSCVCVGCVGVGGDRAAMPQAEGVDQEVEQPCDLALQLQPGLPEHQTFRF